MVKKELRFDGEVVNDVDGPVTKAVADEISAAGGQAVASHDSVATPAGGAAIVDQALPAR